MTRIGIVLTHMDPSRSGGAEVYCRALVHGLAESEPLSRYVLFVPKGYADAPVADHFEVIECDTDPRRRHKRILWEQTQLARLLHKHRLDLVHFPYGTPPLRYNGPAVVTLHDTVRFQRPHEMPVTERWYRALIERNSIKRRHSVIMVSNADLSVFRKHTGLADRHSFVVPLGVNTSLIVDAPLPLGERANELLWVGRDYPLKNLGFLLRIYADLRKAMSDPPALRLIGIGPDHGQALRHTASQLNIADAVCFDPPTPHDQLLPSYRRSKLFIYPSLQESFGLPVAESLAAGTPVVCSRIPAFAELFTQGTAHCDLDSTTPWVVAIKDLLEDSSLHTRTAEQGLALVREHYTHHKMIERTTDVYQQAIAQQPDA